MKDDGWDDPDFSIESWAWKVAGELAKGGYIEGRRLKDAAMNVKARGLEPMLREFGNLSLTEAADVIREM